MERAQFSLTSADHQLSVFNGSQAPIYPRKETSETNRDRLKNSVVTSRNPRKWETFHKKGNDVTKKRKPDF